MIFGTLNKYYLCRAIYFVAKYIVIFTNLFRTCLHKQISFHVKDIKDLLIVSNYVTKYFSC